METFDFLVLSFQSSLGKRKIFSKKKNMEAVEVKLEDILSCEEIPIARLKSYAINAFVMDYIQSSGEFESLFLEHSDWNIFAL